MVVVGLSSSVQSHLVRALSSHAQWCRVNAVPVPAEVVVLLEDLTDSRCQSLPSSPRDGASSDAEAVLLTVDYRAAATRLSVSERTLYRMVAKGELPAVSVGGCRRIRVADLAAYVDGLEG